MVPESIVACYLPDLFGRKECNSNQILSTREEKKREDYCALAPPLLFPEFAFDAKVVTASLDLVVISGRSWGAGRSCRFGKCEPQIVTLSEGMASQSSSMHKHRDLSWNRTTTTCQVEEKMPVGSAHTRRPYLTCSSCGGFSFRLLISSDRHPIGEPMLLFMCS